VMKTLFTLLLLAGMLPAQTASSNWHQRLSQAMPLLGHRNWILIVDSAYPLQISPGIETIDTNASHIDVLRTVMKEIDHSIQIRPEIFTDAELPFVSDSDAPGASAYREQISELFRGYDVVRSQPHEELLSKIDAAGKVYHVLVLKTNMTIPYTSVFIRLDCKYWSEEQERNLRARMKSTRGE
jgi:hypothetical protein